MSKKFKFNHDVQTNITNIYKPEPISNTTIQNLAQRIEIEHTSYKFLIDNPQYFAEHDADDIKGIFVMSRNYMKQLYLKFMEFHESSRYVYKYAYDMLIDMDESQTIIMKFYNFTEDPWK